MTFHLTCVHIIFSSVSIADRPSFGKKLLTRLILVISRFGFEGWSWVLVASVPHLRIFFTFKNDYGQLSLDEEAG